MLCQAIACQKKALNDRRLLTVEEMRPLRYAVVSEEVDENDSGHTKLS